MCWRQSAFLALRVPGLWPSAWHGPCASRLPGIALVLSNGVYHYLCPPAHGTVTADRKAYRGIGHGPEVLEFLPLCILRHDGGYVALTNMPDASHACGGPQVSVFLPLCIAVVLCFVRPPQRTSAAVDTPADTPMPLYTRISACCRSLYRMYRGRTYREMEGPPDL